jgi:hypothetical protein
MAYTKTLWVNREPPSINEDNLNKIETGIGDVHDLLSNVTKVGNELRIGSANDYMAIEEDGTSRANGNATVFLDELNDLLKTGTNNPSAHLVQDLAEGTLHYKNNCDLNDYALMNVQINHYWKGGSAVEPHIHWEQTSDATPNWLIQYRWQLNGQNKTTGWTGKNWSTNAFNYTANSTTNQITSFGNIAAPANYSISDIFQMKILRDVVNTSNLFPGNDSYAGNASATSVDIHIECDTNGSRWLYSK